MAEPRVLSAILTRRQLPALDGLRAVAVLTVILYHAGFSFVPGDLGVSGFFVLSGFLITWLLLKEVTATGEVSFRAFYLRRTLRIFPAYYVFILLTLLADYVLGDPWDTLKIGSAFGYVVNYYNAFLDHPPSSIAHAWSLAVEEQFYLLWPLGFFALAGRGRQLLLAGLAAVIVAVLAWRSWLYLGADAGAAYVYNAFDTRFDNLAIGCLLAATAMDGRFRDAFGVLARHWALPFITASAILVSRVSGGPTYHYSIGFTVDAILMAVLVAQCLILHERAPWRWLDHPLAMWIGRLSYPLYLWHIWGLTVGKRLIAGQPPALSAAFGVALSFVLASLSYRFVETPFLRLKQRFASRG
jgi:peptidoglycan/LPS O-acetylase OafA/YrhL